METKPKQGQITLYALLIGFTLLGSVYSIVTPIFEASDELWHYPLVEYLATHWNLPVQPLEPGAPVGPWRQEASQQPLYYALSAALTAWIDTGDLPTVRHLNPHVAAGVITPDGSNLNLVAHNPAVERFPWRGTVLALHLARLLSVLLGTWAVYLAWALVRELFPERPWLALDAAAVQAFTPMYVFISASVNNDNLTVPLCTLALLLMVRRVKAAGEDRATSRVGLGIVLGLGLLTKASALGLLPLLGATLFWETWRLPTGTPLRKRLAFFGRGLLETLLPALLISGWWYVRNFRLYGDWLGLNAFYAVLGTRDVPAGLAQLWAERFAFAAGYWGNFGGLNVPLPAGSYTLLNAWALAALSGGALLLARWAWVTGKRVWPFSWDNTTAAHALAWAWPAAVFVSWTRWATLTWSSQGRLIFSALPLWSLLLIIGPTGWLPKRYAPLRELLGGALATLLLGLTLLAPLALIPPAYAPPAPLTEAEETSHSRLSASFGNTLELLDYHIETATVRPGDPVTLTLYWKALAPTPTDYSVFVHLQGAGERIIAQRDSFPGRGLLSTTWLEPGYAWAERYVIPTPPMAYAPDALTVVIGVYETATGARLTTPGGGEWVELGQIIAVAPRSGPLPIRFGEGMALTGYELSAVTLAPGETLTVTLHWEALAPSDDDYTVSVQLIDANWNKAGQSDAWPPAPTSAWPVGQRLDDLHALPIAPGVAPGSYDLRLAVYRINEAGELIHLPVLWEPGQMPAEAIVLTRIQIK